MIVHRHPRRRIRHTILFHTTDFFRIYRREGPRTEPGAPPKCEDQPRREPPAAKEAAECLEPRQCPRCYTVNGPTQNFCGECGLELTKQAVEDVKIAEQQAELTPEYQALYDKIMRDLQNLS